MTDTTQSRGIDEAVSLAGSQAKLGVQLGVKQQSICKWVARGYVPLDRAREIEAILGVPRARLADPKVVSILANGWV